MLDDILSNPWAYLPPRSALWLWVAGPVLFLLLFKLIMRGGGAERKRRLREAAIWRASIADPRHRSDPEREPSKDKPRDAGPPRVGTLPAALRAALVEVGGGDAVAHYELVSDVAYLSLMEANALAGSDYQTVTARLEERGPSMSVRPLPVIDGVPALNTGVQFKKDPELMRRFLIEGPDAKAIGKWLSGPIRRALCEVPWAWVRVEGKAVTVTGFGILDAPKLDALVELADTIVAEHGAEGGPSLFGEDEEADGAPAKGKVSLKKRDPALVSTLAETPASKKRA